LQNIAKFDTFLKHYFLYKKNLKKFYKSQNFFQTQQSPPNPAEFLKPSRLLQTFYKPSRILKTQQRSFKPSRVLQTQQRSFKPSRVPQTQQRSFKPSRAYPYMIKISKKIRK
jgi:hypothetical protein